MSDAGDAPAMDAPAMTAAAANAGMTTPAESTSRSFFILESCPWLVMFADCSGTERRRHGERAANLGVFAEPIDRNSQSRTVGDALDVCST